MFKRGRIPLNESEELGINNLISSRAKDEDAVSISRADPGEQGNLLVQIGETTYELDEEGLEVGRA